MSEKQIVKDIIKSMTSHIEGIMKEARITGDSRIIGEIEILRDNVYSVIHDMRKKIENEED